MAAEIPPVHFFDVRSKLPGKPISFTPPAQSPKEGEGC